MDKKQKNFSRKSFILVVRLHDFLNTVVSFRLQTFISTVDTLNINKRRAKLTSFY